MRQSRLPAAVLSATPACDAASLVLSPPPAGEAAGGPELVRRDRPVGLGLSPSEARAAAPLSTRQTVLRQTVPLHSTTGRPASRRVRAFSNRERPDSSSALQRAMLPGKGTHLRTMLPPHTSATAQSCRGDKGEMFARWASRMFGPDSGQFGRDGKRSRPKRSLLRSLR